MSLARKVSFGSGFKSGVWLGDVVGAGFSVGPYLFFQLKSSVEYSQCKRVLRSTLIRSLDSAVGYLSMPFWIPTVMSFAL